MNIGEELKAARETLGTTEREVAERTHLKREFICAMEENRFDDVRLAPVYKIGFLRIYAKFLGLDADSIVAEFKRQKNITAAWAHAKPTSSAAPENVFSNSDPADPAAAPAEFFEEAHFVREIPKKKIFVFAGIAIFVIVLGFFIFRKSPEKTETAPEATSQAAAGTAYEFELTTNISQRIEIHENYVGWDSAKGVPICGNKIVNEYISAGTRKKFTASGTLYIREEVLGGATVKIPDKATFDAAKKGQKIALPSSEAETNQRRGGLSLSWTVEPQT